MRWLVVCGMLLLVSLVSVPGVLAEEGADGTPQGPGLAEMVSQPLVPPAEMDEAPPTAETSGALSNFPFMSGSTGISATGVASESPPAVACGTLETGADLLPISFMAPACGGFVEYHAPLVEDALAGPDSHAIDPPVDAATEQEDAATEEEAVNQTEEPEGLNHTQAHERVILDPLPTPPGPQAIDLDWDDRNWKTTTTEMLSPTFKPLAIASAFAAVTALALLLANFGRIVRLLVGMPATALFSRVNRNKALAHPLRQDLLEVIKSHAGITLPELAQRLGMSRNNATYHLDVLERNELVSSRLIGRCRYFFAGNGSECSKVAVLRNRRRRLIGEYVLVNPKCIQRDICRDLGIPASRVNAQVKRLIAAGLLSAQEDGRALRLEATEDLQSIVATLRATDSMQVPAVGQACAEFDSAGPS